MDRRQPQIARANAHGRGNGDATLLGDRQFNRGGVVERQCRQDGIAAIFARFAAAVLAIPHRGNVDRVQSQSARDREDLFVVPPSTDSPRASCVRRALARHVAAAKHLLREQHEFGGGILRTNIADQFGDSPLPDAGVPNDDCQRRRGLIRCPRRPAT